ncbi:MAG: hypothetical protein WBN34_08275 [Woeseia sp.]
MNREKRKDIVEVVGLAAIVASLIFVASEVREANRASRIAARDSITQGHLEFMGALIDQGVLPTAMWKLFEGAELSEFEAFQIDIHHQRRWRHYERVYYMYQYGVLTDQEWNGFRAAIYDSMNGDSPFSLSSRNAWESSKAILSEEFASYVDALIERKN